MFVFEILLNLKMITLKIEFICLVESIIFMVGRVPVKFLNKSFNASKQNKFLKILVNEILNRLWG